MARGLRAIHTLLYLQLTVSEELRIKDFVCSVYCLTEERLWSSLVLCFIKCTSPHIIAFTELSTLGEHSTADDRLIFLLANCALKFFPCCVSTVAKLTPATNAAACPKDSCLSLHAEGLLWLWLVLGWTHYPVLILLLLIFQELNVLCRHAFLFIWSSKLLHILRGIAERLL